MTIKKMAVIIATVRPRLIPTVLFFSTSFWEAIGFIFPVCIKHAYRVLFASLGERECTITVADYKSCFGNLETYYTVTQKAISSDLW